MNKKKSESGAKKRVRRTGSGRLAIKRSRRNHLLQQKNARQKRLSRTLVVHERDRRALSSLLPYI